MISVSIIIPVYNSEKYLSECLESVLNQSLKEIELICIDDGSTDKSAEILAEYSSRFSNVVVLKQKNQGAGMARNYGLAVAKGEYVVFMDSDDYYANEFVIEKMYSLAINNSALIVGGKYLYYQGGKVIGAEKEHVCFETEGFVDYRDFQESYCHCRFLFKTSLLVENRIFYPEYKRYEDPLFLVKAMLQAGKFYVWPQNVYVYRVGNRVKRYTENVVYDVLSGMRDVLRVAVAERLSVLRDHTINALHEAKECNAAIRYYVYAGRVDIINLVSELNCLCGKEILSIEEAKRSVFEAQLYKMELERKCKNKKVIIYGAGTIGKKVAAIFKKNVDIKILGYAVTEMKGETSGAYPVKPIREYLPIKKDVLIMISARHAIQCQMVNYLKELVSDAEKYLIVDSDMVDVIDLMQYQEESVL